MNTRAHSRSSLPFYSSFIIHHSSFSKNFPHTPLAIQNREQTKNRFFCIARRITTFMPDWHAPMRTSQSRFPILEKL